MKFDISEVTVEDKPHTVTDIGYLLLKIFHLGPLMSGPLVNEAAWALYGPMPHGPYTKEQVEKMVDYILINHNLSILTNNCYNRKI